MQPGLPSLLSKFAFWVCLLSVVILSLMPTDQLPAEVGLVWDKAQHALGFVLLTVLGLMAYPDQRMWLVIGLVVTGAGIEWTQDATGWRHGDVMDWIADNIGIAIGLLAARLTKVGAGGRNTR